MQYAIEITDTDNMPHKAGVGRSWYQAVRAFNSLVQQNGKHVKAAKLVMHTETGHKLDTIVRWPKQGRAA